MKKKSQIPWQKLLCFFLQAGQRGSWWTGKQGSLLGQRKSVSGFRFKGSRYKNLAGSICKRVQDRLYLWSVDANYLFMSHDLINCFDFWKHIAAEICLHETNLTRNRAAEREQRQQELTECQAKLDSCTRQMSETTANLETLNERLSNITDESVDDADTTKHWYGFIRVYVSMHTGSLSDRALPSHSSKWKGPWQMVVNSQRSIGSFP